MFVRVFSCASETNQEFYPVVKGYARMSSNGLIVNVSAENPQPRSRETHICAQLVADEMSFTRYRSNIVIAEISTAG